MKLPVCGREQASHWNSRGHFAAAAEAMRASWKTAQEGCVMAEFQTSPRRNETGDRRSGTKWIRRT
jgi:hypothetical protein